MEDEVEHPCHSLDIDDDDETPLSPPPPSSSSSSLSLLRRCNNQPSPSLRCTIPGPAAAIQAAKLRKPLSNSNSNSNSKQLLDSQISSQNRFNHDSEFDRDPWKFALKSLTNSGVSDRTLLREIKKCANATRIKWVVAIVKSCTPNGLGDMRITLKDETDTIDATVQGKVLMAEDFGKWMTVGSVLILQKVVAFSSSYMSCYLNITRSNIVKVISVNCEVHNFSQANKLDNTPVLSGISATLERPSALACGRSERVIGDVNRSSSMKGTSTIVELTGKEHYTHPRSQNSSRQKKNTTDKTLEEGVHIDHVDSGHTTFGCGYKSQGENLCRSSQPGPSSSEGIFRRLQNLNNDERRQARECSSAPSIIENIGNRNWQASDGQAARLLQDNNCDVTTTENFGTFIMMHKNTDDLDSCDVNDVRKQHNPRAGGSFAPGMVENLNKRGISKFNGVLNTAKSLNMTENEAKASVVVEQDYEHCTGTNSTKKQKVALVSRTAIQEWTEEQLDILDMEDD